MVDLECAVRSRLLDRVALLLIEATDSAAAFAPDLGPQLFPENELEQEVEQRYRHLAEE